MVVDPINLTQIMCKVANHVTICCHIDKFSDICLYTPKFGGLSNQHLKSMSLPKSSILISDFPVELIHVVTDDCEIEQILSLCRVSKHINAVVSRILYRKVTLRSTRAAVRCFQTMLARQDCALAVRVLELDA
jgi:hypothetical protein